MKNHSNEIRTNEIRIRREPPVIDSNGHLVGNSRKNQKVTRSVQNKIYLTLYYIMVILLKKIGVKMAVW